MSCGYAEYCEAPVVFFVAVMLLITMGFALMWMLIIRSQIKRGRFFEEGYMEQRITVPNAMMGVGLGTQIPQGQQPFVEVEINNEIEIKSKPSVQLPTSFPSVAK